jgi:hypothetical protein
MAQHVGRLQAERSVIRRKIIGRVIADEQERGLASAVRDPNHAWRKVRRLSRLLHSPDTPQALYRILRFLFHCAFMNDFIQLCRLCQMGFEKAHKDGSRPVIAG